LVPESTVVPAPANVSELAALSKPRLEIVPVQSSVLPALTVIVLSVPLVFVLVALMVEVSVTCPP
jgi:hypothetical protein